MKFLLFYFFTLNLCFAGFDHSHSLFSKVLNSSVIKKNKQTLVNYKAVKSAPQDLNKYLNAIQSLKKTEFKSFSSDQKLAFWINAYNAYTIKIVADNYPVKSIKEIGDGKFLSLFYNKGPWDKKFIPIFQKKLSLNNIEHDIIRAKFKRPRIHFALNCASMGCPSISLVPFTAKKLEQQLEQASVHFLNNTDKNKVSNKKIYLSKIFKWYGDDFKKYGGVKKFIQKYLPGAKDDYELEFLDYNWNINHFVK